jgi:hypothetical protein
MKIITSFATNRIERQQYCVSTWHKYGYQIEAVQLPHHLDQLRDQFAGVTFIEDDRSGKDFGFIDTIRIKALIDRDDGDGVLIINSDIAMKCDPSKFRREWVDVPGDVFRVGIRWDQDKKLNKSLNKYGIDVFRFSSAQCGQVEDVGYSLGTDVWDYWIIWAMLVEGYLIEASHDPGILHAKHERFRPEVGRDVGYELFRSLYGVNKRQLVSLIGVLTGRR